MAKIKKKDLLKMNFLSGLSFSADKEHLAVAVSKAKEDQQGYDSDIHLYDFAEKKWYQYTGSGKEQRFFWDMERPFLYIMTTRDKKEEEKKKEGHEQTSFYQLTPGKGEAIKKFTIKKNVGKIRQLTADKFLFTATIGVHEKELFRLKEKEIAKELTDRKKEQDYESVEEIPFWSNGAGYSHSRITKLYLYDAAKDKLTILSDALLKDMTVEDFELSEDRLKAVIIYSLRKPMGELTNRLMVVDLNSKEIGYHLQEDQYAINKGFLSGSGEVIALVSDMEKYGINENPKIIKIKPETGEIKEWTPYMDRSFWNSVGSDVRLYGSETIRYEKETLYFTSTRGFDSQLFSIDEQGQLIQLTYGKGSVDEYAFGKDGIYYIGLQEMLPQEIYFRQSGKQGDAGAEKDARISAFNSYFAEKNRITIPEHFTVTDEEGYEIDAWIMRPKKLKADKKYPLILDIHGGPKTVYGEVYYHEMQYWVSEGYAVLFCNPRGSDGKGNDFADIRGKYGEVDYDNLMQVLDIAIQNDDYIDQENIFVTGGSYGGFMTNWIIGHTDRFKAAATQRSIANWISMYGTTDIGYYFATDQTDADPWIDQESMWQQSPMKHLDQAVTPTLIIHSEQDYRCWLAEGIQLFTSLKYHGVESRLVIFKGENHELTRSGRPDHRLRSMTEIFDWFKKYYEK